MYHTAQSLAGTSNSEGTNETDRSREQCKIKGNDIRNCHGRNKGVEMMLKGLGEREHIEPSKGKTWICWREGLFHI